MDKLSNIINKSQAYANSVKDIEQLCFEKINEKQENSNQVNQIMTIWHRPKEEHLYALKERKNLSVVITLQSQSEDIEFIQNICKSLKIGWINIQLHHKGNQDIFEKKDVDQIIQNGIASLRNILDQNKNEVILIHCSAGIHRSGVFSYAILRSLSYDRNESLQKIKSIRKMTFNGLKEYKLDYIDQNIINI
ncbi:tyrosine phosphatase family protein (macronuclear) [Tetrahymena thermophila SB210]|uniref:Tyrosine phosphatase family protein n=1 Tax=Tetrahymena thermophila (strain SB210) TaxID=312017 RepID=W7XGS0_TETTS|nr:tyrosine phosphatase family protein [Tetrahymena thermophila SB210]EWS73406.1 tyrosine phosphatase family protein [Tetrahymena thermophila SB210]|eukprot:XP_012654058.1 tyrosine phosphatase family protein [Tetrahymena thermophila SB210]